ncbi:uncharacterized protein LOC144195766 isoform X2 [Stigmatopora nigra]
MSMRTVNLDTYSLSLLTAKEDILNHRSSTNWALFVYEGLTSKLKLADSGVGGVAELASKFHASKPQYGLCRLGNSDTGGSQIVMIAWVGEHVEEFRRTECAGHIPAIKHFFKEAHTFISAHNADDVTEEKIRAELSKSQTHPHWVKKSSRSSEREDLVGTNYRKTNAAMEMRLINRDSFWAREEREEELRKEEERRRTLDERRRLERERVFKERKESEERDRKMNEKLRMIEEQRRKQAEQEEMLRTKEKFRWEKQQKEHEEDMRARLKRSESIEMAAEAAVLVSQRSMNPREFFRQLSSSSSQSPTSPGSSRAGKPFRRYQRSLTDTACIFSKAENNTPPSPLSSPLVSPFLRGSPSRMGATSPTSPVFLPLASPTKTKVHNVTPPTSPLHNTPQASAPVPTLSPVNQQPVVWTEVISPAETSALPSTINPEASPIFGLERSIPPEPFPGVLPASPPNTPIDQELSTFCFEGPPPQPPSSPLPEIHQLNADLHTTMFVHTDSGFKAQAVLLEVDEEEEYLEEEDVEETVVNNEEKTGVQEDVKEEAEGQLQICASAEELVQAVFVEQMQEEDEEESEQDMETASKEQILEADREESEQDIDPASPKQIQEEDEEESEEDIEPASTKQIQGEDEEESEQDIEPASTKQIQEEDEEEIQKEIIPASPEETTEELHDDTEEFIEETKHNERFEDSQSPDEAADHLEKEEKSELTDEDHLCQAIKLETLVRPTNGFTHEEQENGIGRSLSPSDAEISSPELSACYDLHNTADSDEIDMSENGQEVSSEHQMCVRALYDYQAEDDSEISFEPGDIIRDVETVDKAWWRGWSKDGRQGLFPANYVETI